MNARKFISQYNTDGVVRFAAEQGIQLPNDPAVAEDFLEQAYAQDPMLVFKKIKELHPHGAFMYNAMEYNNKTDGHNNCDCSKCKVKRRFKNFTEDDVDTYMDEAGNVFDKGVQRGKEIAGSFFGNNNQKDHSREMLTYGALVFVGIVIGYAFAKK